MGLFSMFKKSRKVIQIGTELTVVLNDQKSTTLVFRNPTEDLFEFCKNKDNSDADILVRYNEILQENMKEANDKPKTNIGQIIANKEAEKKVWDEKKEVVKAEILAVEESKKGFPLAIATGDFTEQNGLLYLNNVPLSIPKLLIEKFMKLIPKINENDADALDEYVALKNFWCWLSLNPNGESRENLFKFIQNNSLKINQYGFLCSYRRVNKVGNEAFEDNNELPLDKSLSEFITKSWLKIKGQKKAPKNFYVFQDDDTQEYFYNVGDEVASNSIHQAFNSTFGNLNDLYQQVITPSEAKTISVQTYTDDHTGKMDIRIGKEVFMNPEECDWNNHQSCSRGLHIASLDGHGCGDTLIAVLVNPMKICAVPYADGSKARCWAYFPVAVLDNFGELDSIDTLDLGTEYYRGCIKEMNELLSKNTPTELKQHKLMNDLSKDALQLIAKQNENIQDTIDSRIVRLS